MTVATNFLGVERQLITIEKCMESGLKYIYFAADFQKFSGEGASPLPKPHPPRHFVPRFGPSAFHYRRGGPVASSYEGGIVGPAVFNFNIRSW